MVDHAIPGAGDFEAMARQYWNLWGDALRQMGGASSPQAPGWQQALDWWSRLMPAGMAGGGDVIGRFRQQSGDWYGLMQQIAARHAGQDASAADISQAWKQALGADAAQGPWRDLFHLLQGGGASGFDGWYRQVTPWLDTLQRESERWLHLPAFGPAREHQERWQALIQSQQDYQRRLADFEQLMLRVAQLAFERFETLLEARSEPGQQITSARALFDLWIDAAEQAYAEVALSPDFRRVYGALTNAQMRLRLGVQGEVEQICVLLGMPSRTEVDSAHRKIAELERRLRRMEKQASAPARAADESRPAQAASTPSPQAARPVRSSAKKNPANAARKPAAAAAKARATRTGSVSTKAGSAKRAAATEKKAPAAAKRAAGKSARTGDGKAKKGEAAAVVSMKDWVARYADDGKRKGKRGSAE